MPSPPSGRSVRIGDDERGGWSSDRPRPGGQRRPVDISVRSRLLAPSDRLRYSPGSLVVIVSASVAERDRFVSRLIDDRVLLSLDKVRGLLAGRLPEDEIEVRAPELLDAAAGKRLAAGETVVLAAEGLDPEERERLVRLAHGSGRPRHLILLEAPREEVAEEDLPAVNDLRRRLDAGQIGEEGFQTALRLGGGAAGEVKRILFRPPPREE